MIYNFKIDSTEVRIYNSRIPLINEVGVLNYSFATNSKTCRGLSCTNCPLEGTSKLCSDTLREIIINSPEFTSKFPEMLL